MDKSAADSDLKTGRSLAKDDIFAWAAVILGVLGMCTPIVPPCGILMGLISILMGYIGRKSDQFGLAVSGMVLGVMILSSTGLVTILMVVLNYEEIVIFLKQLL